MAGVHRRGLQEPSGVETAPGAAEVGKDEPNTLSSPKILEDF